VSNSSFTNLTTIAYQYIMYVFSGVQCIKGNYSANKLNDQ